MLNYAGHKFSSYFHCRFDAVVHFAGLKAVGESVQKPLLYFNNNLIGTITLLEVMAAHGCKKVFCLSCHKIGAHAYGSCLLKTESFLTNTIFLLLLSVVMFLVDRNLGTQERKHLILGCPPLNRGNAVHC